MIRDNEGRRRHPNDDPATASSSSDLEYVDLHELANSH
jgi:hypothetical protein